MRSRRILTTLALLTLSTTACATARHTVEGAATVAGTEQAIESDREEEASRRLLEAPDEATVIVDFHVAGLHTPPDKPFPEDPPPVEPWPLPVR